MKRPKYGLFIFRIEFKMLTNLTVLARLSNLRPDAADVDVIQAWITSCYSEDDALYIMRCFFPQSHSQFGSTLLGWLRSEGLLKSQVQVGLSNPDTDESKPIMPKIDIIKSSLKIIATSALAIETLRKQYYAQEGFNLAKIFNDLSNGGDFITSDSLRSRSSKPASITDTTKIMSIFHIRSDIGHDQVSLRQFRQAVSPSIHYLECLVVDCDDGRVDDGVDDGYVLLAGEARFGNVDELGGIYLDLRGVGKEDGEDSMGQRFGSPKESKIRALADRNVPPLIRKKDQEPEYDYELRFDSLQNEDDYESKQDTERFKEYSDYPSSEDKIFQCQTPKTTHGNRENSENAPRKDDLRVPHLDSQKRVTKKLDYNEAQYWNNGRDTFNPLDFPILVPKQVKEPQIYEHYSPVAKPHNLKSSPVAYLNTTLPKDSSALNSTEKHHTDGCLKVKRQISFDDF